MWLTRLLLDENESSWDIFRMSSSSIRRGTKQNGLIFLTIIGCFFLLTTLISYSFLENNDVDEENDYFFERRMPTLRQQQQLQQRMKHHMFGDSTKHASMAASLFHSFRDVNDKQMKRAKKLLTDYESKYPPSDIQRARDFVYRQLRRDGDDGARQETMEDVPYDIYNCPPTPPKDYPMQWNTLDVLRKWNPADTEIPQQIHQGLCVFDFDQDFEKALTYRNAEMPFIVRNQSDLLLTSERWNVNDNAYLHELLKDEEHRVEHSLDMHFMYFKDRRGAKKPEDWTPPMDETKLSFDDWHAKASDVQQIYDEADDEEDLRQLERYYFRVNGDFDHQHSYLYQELPIFDYHKRDNFFIVERKEQRGINCRFGMPGVIAEAHYDQSRNFIVLMGGQRRYILSHPRACQNLCLYPSQHPSGRHSSVDWTEPEKAAKDCPPFAEGTVNEVVLEAGDAMYLPTHWMHFIVSLTINYQCNARSGTTFEHMKTIQSCGF